MSIPSHRSLSNRNHQSLPGQAQDTQIMNNEQKRQFGSYLHIIQKRQRMLQTSLLPQTILADKIQPKKLMIICFKVAILLLVVIQILNLGPSSLRVQFQSDTIRNCQQNYTCIYKNNNQMQIKNVLVRHLSPLNRKLKVYLEINSIQIQKNPEQYQHISYTTLQQQISTIQIYKARQGDGFDSPVTYISGSQIIQDLLFERPMFFAGDIHVLDQPSYLIKIVRTGGNQSQSKTRRLEVETENNKIKQQVSDDKAPVVIQSQNNTNINEGNNSSINTDNNTSKNQTTHNNQTSIDNNTIPIPVIPVFRKYHPLVIWIVTRSIYYSVIELLVRYISLLLIIYIITQTPESPKILAVIMITYCNPLIFLQIASPNQFSTIITAISNSAYLGFLIIFIYYCHQKYTSPMTNTLILMIKETIAVILILTNILRLQHFYEGFQIWFVQCILFIFILVFLWGYLWEIFVYYKQQLHRDILTVAISLWYLLVVFTAGFIVSYGWYDLIKYIVVQIYAVKITYFTDKYQISKKWEPFINKKQNFKSFKGNNSSKLKQNKDAISADQKLPTDQRKFSSDQNIEHLHMHQSQRPTDTHQIAHAHAKQGNLSMSMSESMDRQYCDSQILYVQVLERNVILKEKEKNQSNLDQQLQKQELQDKNVSEVSQKSQ